MQQDIINDEQERGGDSRQYYVKPDLIEAGKIADVTLSNGNTGGDGGYS